MAQLAILRMDPAGTPTCVQTFGIGPVSQCPLCHAEGAPRSQPLRPRELCPPARHRKGDGTRRGDAGVPGMPPTLRGPWGLRPEAPLFTSAWQEAVGGVESFRWRSVISRGHSEISLSSRARVTAPLQTASETRFAFLLLQRDSAPVLIKDCPAFISNYFSFQSKSRATSSDHA